MSDTARALAKSLKKGIWRTNAVAALIATAFAQSAGAVIDVPVYDQNGNIYANLKVLEVGEDHLIPDAFGEVSHLRAMNEYDYKGLVLGFDYMTDLLGPAVYAPTIYVTLDATQNDNAAASSYAQLEENNGVVKSVGTALFGSVTGLADHGDTPHTFILLNLPSTDTAWRYQQIDILPRMGLSADLPGTVLHELVHAYGLITGVLGNEEEGYQFHPVNDYFTPYTAHLYDAFDQQAIADQKLHVIKPDENGNFNNVESGRVTDQFNVLYRDANSGVRFKGDNVTEVIGEETVIYNSDTTIVDEDGKLVTGTIINSVKGGIPINGFEYISYPEYVSIDFNHIELQNSLMSHQNYRNWQTLMEAEMALLQDIGYEFDRKRYFGKSIYASNTTETITQAFSQRQNNQWLVGEPSTQSWAIGTHVYGSLNKVTVAADQLADGLASIGVRVDGVKNNIVIDKNVKITANGTRGLGIAFAYGRNHTLTVGSGAQIEANGLGGTALSFDFGSNEMADYSEYRGSYMRFMRYKDEWLSLKPEIDAINSAMMDSVVVEGSVSATGLGGRAIYIAPNALVSKIELTDSAVVKGDIVSDWNAQAVVVNKESGSYYITSHKLYPTVGALIPIKDNEAIDLTTELVLGNITFEGNIIGADGIRLTVGKNDQTISVANSGVTKLTGLVRVLGVNVNAGATLTGGATYVLTPMKGGNTQAIVGENTDFEQQTFVNKGKLISSPATGTTYIDGNYTQSKGATLTVGIDGEGNLFGLGVAGTVTFDGESVNIGLVPSGYFKSGVTVATKDAHGSPIIGQNVATPSASYKFDSSVQYDELSKSLNFKLENDTLTVTRQANAYSRVLATTQMPAWQREIVSILDTNANTVTDRDAQNLIADLDFSSGNDIAGKVSGLGGDAHIMAVRSHFSLERLLDRTLSFATQNPAPEGKFVWVQPFGGKVSEHFDEGTNNADIAGLAGGVTIPTATGLIGWQALAAYMKTDDTTGGQTQSEGLWISGLIKDYPYNNGSWFVEGSARLGVANTETERRGMAQTLKTDGIALSLSGSAKVGADIDLNAFELSPFAGFAFTTLRMPSDTESGTGALDVDSGWYTSVRGQLGVKASTDYLTSQVAGYAWKWDVYAMYEREFTGDAGSFTTGLKGMNGTFTREVTFNDQNRYLVGVSLGLFNETGFAASLRLDSEMTHGQGSAVTGSAQLRWKF